MSMKFKILLIPVLFLVVIFVMVGAAYLTTNHQKDDAVKINLAGRQRMLSQKMSKELISWKTGEAGEESKAIALNSANVFDQTLKALIAGGPAPLTLDLEKGEFRDLSAESGETLILLQKVQEQWGPFFGAFKRVLSDEGNQSEDLAFIKEKNIPLLKSMNAAVVQMQKDGEGKVSNMVSILFLGLLAAVVLAIISSIMFLRTLKVIMGVTNSAEIMSKGDFLCDITHESGDEIGQLAKGMRWMRDFFHTQSLLVRRGGSSILGTTGGLDEVSKELESTAEALATNCEKVLQLSNKGSDDLQSIKSRSLDIKEQLNTVAAASEEMASSISSIAGSAENAKKMTESAAQNSFVSTQNVQELSKSVLNINSVIEKIQDIADQTNLLALNATIEAARAGEAGRGFSVVASEIKDLAHETTGATEEITKNISQIQLSSRKTIEIIESITNMVQDSKEMVDSIALAVREQADVSQEVSHHIANVSDNIENINNSIAQLSEANLETVKDIDLITYESRQISSHGQNIGEIAGEMKSNSNELFEGISTIRLSEELFNIGEIKAGHFKWKTQINSILAGYLNLDSSSIPNHHECAFGKWYDNVDPSIQQAPAFEKINGFHKQVHEKIVEIVDLHNKGKTGEAKRRLTSFEESRRSLFNALNELYMWRG